MGKQTKRPAKSKLPPAMLKVFQGWGATGAAKRNRNLTPERRRDIARKAIAARWAKARSTAKDVPDKRKGD